MAEPLLTEVFGAGASQDATNLTIAKADLVGVGLTSGASIRAEALFVALLKKARTKLNPTNRAEDTDIQITIAETFRTKEQVGDTWYNRRDWTVSLYVVDTSDEVDPDNY